MPQSLHLRYSHIVFSTKNRDPIITADMELKLYDYLGGIVKNLGGKLLEANGMSDQVHLITRDSKSVTDIDFIRELKSGSSKWVNENYSVPGKFAWQAGYGWFSVGPPGLEKAKAYVISQKEHHKKETFQDEFRRFLVNYGVEYDERYLWD